MAASVVLVSSSMGIAGATPIAHQGGGEMQHRTIRTVRTSNLSSESTIVKSL